MSEQYRNLKEVRDYCFAHDHIPAPTQSNSSVSEYIKLIKLYAIAVGKDLDNTGVKAKFLCGLHPDIEQRVYGFGVKKPLTEIFEYLAIDLEQ